MLAGVLAGAVIAVVAAIAISSGNKPPTRPGPQQDPGDGDHQDRSTRCSRDPPERNEARQPESAGDDDLLRRPRVPDLPGLHAAGRLVTADLQRRQAGQGQGRLQIVLHRDLQRPRSEVFNTQQVAAYAAGMQHKFWNYAETFYREQGAEDTGYVNENYLVHLPTRSPDWTYPSGRPTAATLRCSRRSRPTGWPAPQRASRGRRR